MDVSFLGGPQPQRGVGVIAPFDFALDRELWRWVPDEVSLHLTRTPFVPVEVSLDLARLVSEHETLRDAARALSAVAPEVLAYACTSGSFVGGVAGERGMCAALEQAGEMPALTTSGALLEALREIGARRIALVTPYTRSVTTTLEEYLGEDGILVTGRAYLGLTRHIWKVPYRDVVDMARQAVVGAADALFISCTNLPTYDVIPQLEAELRMPVLSANQVTMWAALRRIGERAVGPYQALLDPVARRGPAGMSSSVPEPGHEAGSLPGTGSLEEPLTEALADSVSEPLPESLTEPVPEPFADPPGGPGTLVDPVLESPFADRLVGPPPGTPVDPVLEPGPHLSGELHAELSGGRGEPEAAYAGPAGMPEAESVEGLDPPPYPDEPGGPPQR